MKVDIKSKKIGQVNNADKIVLNDKIGTKQKLKNNQSVKVIPSDQINSFIVHGHDNELKKDLKDFLQNKLGFKEPILLHQQPDNGLTIIEKLELHTDNIDLVFILLTPDDFSIGLSNRTRQNVIFELGFFLGKFGRKSGRVLLLTKGDLELPSDLGGILTIDISNGIDPASQFIRDGVKHLAKI